MIGSVIGMMLLALVVTSLLAHIARRVWTDAGREWRFVYRSHEYE